MFEYTDEKSLKNEYKKALIDVNASMVNVGKKIGVTRQQIWNIFNKKNLSFNDVKRLLNAIDYDLYIEFIKRSDK